MAKSKRRYLIRFGETNKNGHVYTRESLAGAELPDPCLVHFDAPTWGDDLGSVFGHCGIGVDETGVYMDGFKFGKLTYLPNTPLTSMSSTILKMYKMGLIAPVTAGFGKIDGDGTITEYRLTSVFFTPEPANMDCLFKKTDTE